MDPTLNVRRVPEMKAEISKRSKERSYVNVETEFYHGVIFSLSSTSVPTNTLVGFDFIFKYLTCSPGQTSNTLGNVHPA